MLNAKVASSLQVENILLYFSQSKGFLHFAIAAFVLKMLETLVIPNNSAHLIPFIGVISTRVWIMINLLAGTEFCSRGKTFRSTTEHLPS